MKFSIAFLMLIFSATFAAAQARSKPRAVPAKPTLVSKIDKGAVVGRTYTNRSFGFEITFPDTWLIPGDDFESYMKAQGFDLSLKAPDSLTPLSKAKVDRALKQVDILLTAYRSMPGTADNAIARIWVEDLSGNPQIKDAVDYFDAIRTMYKGMKLPADFTYSETQAEKLGTMQFGFIDTESKAGKKRLYATVRKGFAICLALSYSADDDLATFRQTIKEANFMLKAS